MFYFSLNYLRQKNSEITDNPVNNTNQRNLNESPFLNLIDDKSDVNPNNILGGRRYPGFGYVNTHTLEPYIVITEKTTDIKTNFLDVPSNRSKYPEDLYDISDFPVQEYLYYVVGFFKGFENIPNSTDRYLLVSFDLSEEIHKFREASEKSDLFGPEITGYYVSYIKNDSEPLLSPIDNIDPVSAGYEELSYSQVDSFLKEGDPVVIFPIVRIPQLAVKDERGNYLVSFAVIRK